MAQNTADWVPVSVDRVILLDGVAEEQVMIGISSTLDLLRMQLQVIRKLINSYLNMGY